MSLGFAGEGQGGPWGRPVGKEARVCPVQWGLSPPDLANKQLALDLRETLPGARKSIQMTRALRVLHLSALERAAGPLCSLGRPGRALRAPGFTGSWSWA